MAYSRIHRSQLDNMHDNQQLAYIRQMPEERVLCIEAPIHARKDVWNDLDTPT